ncbi:MAG: hypothetical protein Q8M07_21835 [Prosthecobacter sp.]|nr:hypothetical protein [Prosthecobacter sp.]
MDEPTVIAASTLLLSAPAAMRIAEARKWVDANGIIDWGVLGMEADDLGQHSGAEQRLILAAHALYKIDLWGLDGANSRAAQAAFQAAADAFGTIAAECEAVELRFAIADIFQGTESD